MADRETEALTRKVAELEAQLKALRQAIAFNGATLTISAPAGIVFKTGGTITIMSVGETALTTRALKLTARGEAKLTFGKALALSVSDGLTAAIGKGMSVNAGDNIEMKTGGASLALRKDGAINIIGSDVTMRASGKIDARASGDMTLKGSKISQN